ncbi:MAG: hypothetical protein WAZ12_01140 [Candidatus Absconditicoccaceae bacterium]
MANDLNLQEFFESRAMIEKMLDDTLEQKLKVLLALVPKELETYFQESSFDAKWLKDMYSNTLMNSCNNDKIKEPESYGFKKSKADVVRKMKLLKEAWKDIIDVDIDNRSWYVEVRFKLILVAKK